MMFWGLPIWVSTLSSHWRGPCRWTSIQQGVEVTSCRWYSAPQPFTKLILQKTYMLANTFFFFFVNIVAIPDGTHLGQLVDGLEPVVDGLREKGGKLLVVEDLETAARRDFAHCCRVKPETS